MANPGMAFGTSPLPDPPRDATMMEVVPNKVGVNMPRSGPWCTLALCLASSVPASAQVVWDMPNIVVPKAKFDTSTVARADAWPRLDPGAVFCKTEGDLQRLAESRRGVPGERPNCQLIHSPTAIAIVKRAGPGRTEVSVTGQQGLSGWTDVWLPDRAPPIGGKGIQIR